MSARLLAAIVLLAGIGTAAGAEFGRMFFTPAQRAALDGFRKMNVQTAAITEDDRDKDLVAPTAQGPERMSVNGMVRRSDGKNSVWINNRAVDPGQPGGGNVAPARNDNRVRLTDPQSGRSYELKVGQSVDIQSGTIEEGYARREVAKPVPETVDKPVPTSAPAAQSRTAPRASDTQEREERGRLPPTEESSTVGRGRPAPIEQAPAR